MKLLLLVVVGIVVVLQFAEEAHGDCCTVHAFRQPDHSRCGDLTQGTPCCGYGPCNIFCCNCEGGCRQGRRRRFAGDHLMEVFPRERRDGTHVVALGDRDGDGKMSLEEGLAHLDHLEDKEVVKRSLGEMDLDGDGFLSPKEVDPSE